MSVLRPRPKTALAEFNREGGGLGHPWALGAQLEGKSVRGKNRVGATVIDHGSNWNKRAIPSPAELRWEYVGIRRISIELLRICIFVCFH